MLVRERNHGWSDDRRSTVDGRRRRVKIAWTKLTACKNNGRKPTFLQLMMAIGGQGSGGVADLHSWNEEDEEEGK
ncbi:unnamed protein product [Citrullus colocynthis]|uniref:Uncharacterized protein n=1 Tax=Citrullus colocynthis TaxID=252529 RepID=A0ABP0XMQ1_9ROSI